MAAAGQELSELRQGARAVWDHVLTPAQRRGLLFVRDGLEVNVEGTSTLRILSDLKLVAVEVDIRGQSSQRGSGISISLTAFGEAAIPSSEAET